MPDRVYSLTTPEEDAERDRLQEKATEAKSVADKATAAATRAARALGAHDAETRRAIRRRAHQLRVYYTLGDHRTSSGVASVAWADATTVAVTWGFPLGPLTEGGDLILLRPADNRWEGERHGRPRWAETSEAVVARDAWFARQEEVSDAP